MKIPKKLQAVLWSADTNSLGLQKDKYYIIHQIFAYGTLQDMKWVFKHYTKKEIIETFKTAFKDYRKSRFYFIKNIILNSFNWQPDERFYVKNTPRIIG